MFEEHGYYMDLALTEARKAYAEDEVPVGAVLVDGEGGILAVAHNQTIGRHDPTAHAEITAIRNAGKKIKNYRFLKTTLYVTVEPCIMCMGAIIHSRISHVVFGAMDAKWGAAGSLYQFQDDRRLNHQLLVTGGVCEEACRQLMQDFFKTKRQSVMAR
ncbi:MAG: tRNA adenosine(34) deaminase TadA [Desulfobacteraceae bacterium]|nr:MAG: tRNA adenosine(34) deaminase TadA [Desulfobacteraceae bacterium]